MGCVAPSEWAAKVGRFNQAPKMRVQYIENVYKVKARPMPNRANRSETVAHDAATRCASHGPWLMLHTGHGARDASFCMWCGTVQALQTMAVQGVNISMLGAEDIVDMNYK